MDPRILQAPFYVMIGDIMTQIERAGVDELIHKLSAAVRLKDVETVTQQIKCELEALIRAGTLQLPQAMTQPRADCYARRLLHRDPQLGYTAIVMTWGPGQKTALHDHAGIWCVEGVVEGEMDVTQYQLLEETPAGCRFEPRGSVHASVGSAGCLIPPFDTTRWPTRSIVRRSRCTSTAAR